MPYACVFNYNKKEKQSLNNTIALNYSVVSIMTGYELDDREIGVRVLVESRIFSSPSLPDRFWGSPNLLSKVYRGLFFQG
jgi:hypothetical protein